MEGFREGMKRGWEDLSGGCEDRRNESGKAGVVDGRLESRCNQLGRMFAKIGPFVVAVRLAFDIYIAGQGQ